MAVVEGDMRGREGLDDAAGGCGNNVHLCLFAVAKSAGMMRHPVQEGARGLLMVRGDTSATHRPAWGVVQMGSVHCYPRIYASA